MGKRLKRVWAMAAGFAAIALLVFSLLSGWPGPEGSAATDAPRPHDGAAHASAPHRSSSASDAAASPAPAAYPAELPGSLRGTDVVGGFVVGDDGHLVPTRDALALFDYYLAATGEEPTEMLRARIVDAIHARIEGVAAEEAVALLDDYLGFRDELRALAEGGTPAHDLERRLQWVRELRRAHFGADTAEALFGEEEAALAIDLERRRVQRDDSIDEATRAERLATLEAELPEEVRAARERARAPARSFERVEAMREAGASDEEIFALRTEQFGPEAAERLAALDAEQAAWKARLETFRSERAEIESDESGLTADEIDAEIEALLHAHFEEHELRRVRAIESL